MWERNDHMPAITTHHLFADEVLTKTKINVNKDLYYVFCQSFDHLFYYNLLSFKKGKDIRKLGHYAHSHNTQEYFINMIKMIKEYKLENDKECLSYLYGSLTHYIMDSIFHPFIFYKTGVLKKGEKETYKYNGLHTKIEAMLDIYFYEKTFNKPYYKFKSYNYNFPKINFSDNLYDLINKTF